MIPKRYTDSNANVQCCRVKEESFPKEKGRGPGSPPARDKFLRASIVIRTKLKQD